MALTLDIGANTRQAQAQVKDLGKALEEVSDALDDVAKDADKSGSKVERELDGMGDAAKSSSREIDAAGERVERSFKDIVSDAKKADRAIEDIGDSGGRNLRKVSEAGEEVSSELKQNLGETFSSFRGDIEDIPQIAQDVFGGLAGSVGGLGASLALAGGAAGVGLLVAGFQQLEERRQELEDRANGLAQAYIEAGSSVLDAIGIASRTSEIITGEERDKAKEYADILGIDLATAARAMAGDMNALAAVNEIANRATDDAIRLGNQYNETGKALSGTQNAKVEADLKAVGAARELNGVVEDATAKFNDQQSVLKGLITSADSASVSVDDLGNTVYQLPDGAQIMIDAKTGQASADVSRFRGDTDGVIDHLNGRQVRMRVDLDDSAIRYYRPPTITIPGQIVARGTVAQY
ncbi:hypothetical protein [Microbacterium sp. BH-3-3-3]|uniref:hypothetical protein n=1 Tax=Microbacterium sp. BH-3-3-3 TaxID=1906742 RepID=UPI000892A259|nr:hypothetical protein [Microbacterium sp. BH-3-3-3]AOX46705.1 hypothetical protein BJP65_13625 [Microbacterium sp. BH-3-3-3]